MRLGIKRRIGRISLLSAGLSLLLVGAVYLGRRTEKSDLPAGNASRGTPSQYADYVFEHSDRVINIGVQPLYSPTGLITSAMERDRVLKRALARLGMKMRTYAFLKGDDVNTFLARGDLNAGVGGDMPALSAAAKMNIVIPVILQKGFTSIVARHAMLLSQLKGKRIAFPFGSIAHYIVLDVLTSENIPASEVRLRPMDFQGMSEALHRHRIDAFAVWEPICAMALKTHPNFHVIYQQMDTGYLYFSASTCTRHPKAVRILVAAVVRAFRWITSHRRNLQLACEWSRRAGEKMYGRSIPLTDGELGDLARRDIFGLTSVPSISSLDLDRTSPLHKEMQFLKTLGKLPAGATWKAIRGSFDSSILSAVMASPETYGINDFDYRMESDEDDHRTVQNQSGGKDTADLPRAAPQDSRSGPLQPVSNPGP